MRQGASKTRVITISFGLGVVTFRLPLLGMTDSRRLLAAPALVTGLGFHLGQHCVQRREALLPELAIALQPVGRRRQRHWLQAARPALRVLAAPDQPGP